MNRAEQDAKIVEMIRTAYVDDDLNPWDLWNALVDVLRAEVVEDAPQVVSSPDPLQTFLAAWNTLPPLVRASAGANMAMDGARREQALTHDVKLEGVLHMLRRQQVTRRFARAYGLVTELLIALTNAADGEATERGIDLDVGTFE